MRICLLLASVLAPVGCTSAVDMLPEKLGGLPSDAPQRPATALPTPNIYEVRPTRAERPLSDAEQKKLESDLTALRESEKLRANPPPPPPAPPPGRKAVAKDSGSRKPAAKDAAAARKPAGPIKLGN